MKHDKEVQDRLIISRLGHIPGRESEFECRSLMQKYAQEMMPKWVSVEDHLPEKDGYTLVYRPDQLYTRVEVLHFIKSLRSWPEDEGGGDHSGITHWMPLPAPPTVKEPE